MTAGNHLSQISEGKWSYLKQRAHICIVSNAIYPNIFKHIKNKSEANLEVPKPYPVIQNGERKHVVHKWLTPGMIPWCTKDLVGNKPVSFSSQHTMCSDV